MEHLPNEQNQAFYLDSIYLPGSSLYFPSNELSSALSSYVYNPEAVPGSSGSSETEAICSTKVQQLHDSSEKKKNHRKGSSQATGLSKCKSRRMKKSCCGKKEAEKETPSDFIRVRARRGQATDSHSLAERKRRERISNRMEILQGLVPGCDKVTGKALVLDEIINYVQSLKNQVEFLSMKLASVSPIVYEYGFVFDGFSSTPELLGDNPQLVPAMIGSSHIQTAGDNFSVIASAPTPLLLGQEAGDFFMQASEQNDALDHQVELYGMCSF